MSIEDDAKCYIQIRVFDIMQWLALYWSDS